MGDRKRAESNLMEQKRRSAVAALVRQNKPIRPDTLLSLARADEACRLMLEGLHLHYLESVTSNRMDAWRGCAVAIVNYIADDPHGVKRAKRKDMKNAGE